MITRSKCGLLIGIAFYRKKISEMIAKETLTDTHPRPQKHHSKLYLLQVQFQHIFT